MNDLLRRAIYSCTLGRISLTPGSGDGACYLTFDDGPHPVHTRRLLDLLDMHRARSTFFLVGKHVEQAPEVASEIVERGHALGNHSFHHKSFWGLPLRRQLAEIEATDHLLERFDGRRSHVFRPPQGRLTLPLALALMRRGTRTVLWTRDSKDYLLETPAVVERLSERSPGPGDVLLFHDDGPRALDVLEVMLPRWCSSGLRFDRISS
jgi:peptidoglycan/xylan/chitin deacetylase (PgdA/CDA1 family)